MKSVLSTIKSIFEILNKAVTKKEEIKTIYDPEYDTTFMVETEEELFKRGLRRLDEIELEEERKKRSCEYCIFLYQKKFGSAYQCLKYNEYLTVHDTVFNPDMVNPLPQCRFKYLDRDNFTNRIEHYHES